MLLRTRHMNQHQQIQHGWELDSAVRIFLIFRTLRSSALRRQRTMLAYILVEPQNSHTLYTTTSMHYDDDDAALDCLFF